MAASTSPIYRRAWIYVDAPPTPGHSDQISCGRHAGAVDVGDYIVLAVRDEANPHHFGEARITEVASIEEREEPTDWKASNFEAGPSPDAESGAPGSTHIASLRSIEGHLNFSIITFEDDPILRDNGPVRSSETGLYRLTALERDAILQKFPDDQQRRFSSLELVPFREDGRCSALALGDYRYARRGLAGHGPCRAPFLRRLRRSPGRPR